VNQVVQQWRTKISSLKFKAPDPKIRTAVTTVAVEDVAEVLLEVHLLDVEVTMVTTVTANPKVITNNKMAPNQHAGGATSMVTDKKIAARESKPKLRARG
jgi:hypothetical protein